MRSVTLGKILVLLLGLLALVASVPRADAIIIVNNVP